MRTEFDFRMVIGTDFTGPSSSTELALDARLASNMGAPVLAVVNGHDLDEAAVATAMDSSSSLLTRLGCSIVATIVNLSILRASTTFAGTWRGRGTCRPCTCCATCLSSPH